MRDRYDFLLYVFYVTCVTTIFFVVSKTDKKGIKSFTKRNPEVLRGTIIVIGAFIFVEICTEFIMAIIWTVHVGDSFVACTVFLAALVYYSPGFFSLFKIVRKVQLYCRGHYNRSRAEKDSTTNKKDYINDAISHCLCCSEHNKKYKVEISLERMDATHDKKGIGEDVKPHCPEHCKKDKLEKSFDKKAHKVDSVNDAKIEVLFKCFVWTAAYFAYILLYSFFPAFVLAFAYPIRVITIFAFIVTFMVLSTVYLITYIKKGVTLKVCANCNNSLLKIGIWCILMVTLVYFFLFVFSLLYSLVIGRASVVSSAPLAILSLLPSVLISVAAWILKSTMLDKVVEKDTKNKDEDNENKDKRMKTKGNEDELDGEVITNEQIVDEGKTVESNGEENCSIIELHSSVD